MKLTRRMDHVTLLLIPLPLIKFGGISSNRHEFSLLDRFSSEKLYGELLFTGRCLLLSHHVSVSEWPWNPALLCQENTIKSPLAFISLKEKRDKCLHIVSGFIHSSIKHLLAFSLPPGIVLEVGAGVWSGEGGGMRKKMMNCSGLSNQNV